MHRRGALILAAATLAGCEAPPPGAFSAGEGPAFRPDLFFEGRTRSFGVFETAAGAPTRRFAVEGVGVREADGGLSLRQSVRVDDDAPFERAWRLRALGEGRYEATGPAIHGTAVGEARGRAFRLSYIETLPPGGWFRTFRFDHWMYLADDGAALVNRFTLSKLGIVVARATEVFGRVPA